MIRKIYNERWSYFLLLPYILFFMVFLFLPVVLGMIYSFFDYDFSSITFNGVENFIKIFTDTGFITSIGITFIIAAFTMPATVGISLGIAAVIDKTKKRTQAILKACFFIPAVVSQVAIAISWKYMFNPSYGFINYVLNATGLASVDWLGNPVNARIVIVIVLVTIFIGQPIILFSAAMAGVPLEYYESAQIDGASETRKFFSITLPLMKPTTLFVFVMATINSFQIFVIPYILTRGGPQYGTTTILYKLYMTAFEFGKLGLASSMGVVLFIIISIITVIEFKIMKSDFTY